jgi:hypothetical protein
LLYLAASNVDRSRLGMEGARTRVDLLTLLEAELARCERAVTAGG